MNGLHEFLLVEEGFTQRGYIPNNNGVVIGKSGLTIAAGVDVGQMGLMDFNNLPMSVYAREALRPYVNVRGEEAMRLFERGTKVKITVADAEAISNYMFDKVIDEVRKKWRGYDDMPPEAQTVLVSLAYNLGLRGSPSTSGKVANAWYSEAISELRDQGEWANRELDGRRNREADLLEEIQS